MIKEAIETILTLAPNAAEGLVPELNRGHDKAYRLHDGSLIFHECQPPRRHTAANVRDFVQAVETFKGEAAGSHPDIFIDEESVVANLDSTNRLDTVEMPLVFSEAMKALDHLRVQQDVSQDQFIRALETTLSGCVSDDVLVKCRTVKVDNRGVVKSHVSQGKRSMGVDIDSEVEGAVNLPEEIEVELPVFSNLDLRNNRLRARCRLIVSPLIKFTLFITSEERQRIIDETLEYLYGTFVKAGVSKERLFIGAP